jgi:hypothetical protein
MKKILIVSLSNISTDPRILRQVDTLSPNYEIHVVGYGKAIDKVSTFHELIENSYGHSKLRRKLIKAFYLILRRYKNLYFYESRTKFRSNVDIYAGNYDLILANDFESLPLVKYSMGKNARILLDAHEYYFDEINAVLSSKLFRQYRKWVARCASSQIIGLSTVSQGIVNLYKSELGIDNISLIRNIPKKASAFFEARISDQISIIHHGAAVQGRGISDLISLMYLLDEKFSLNLMLVETDPKFLNDLISRAKPLGGRVKFLDPVPTQDIVDRIKSFDLGIHLIPPLSINNKFALPNKFFEFVQANLGIVTGPSPEMTRLMEEHSLGVASSSFELKEVARVINDLDRSQVEILRANSHEAAEMLCWERESKVLLSQVSSLIGVSNGK